MANLNPLEQKARSAFIKGFIIAILFGIIGCIILGYFYLSLKKSDQEKEDAKLGVVVLTKNVSAGAPIDRSMLRKTTVDPDLVTRKETFKSVDELLQYYQKNEGNDIKSTDDPTNNSTTPTSKKASSASVVDANGQATTGATNTNNAQTNTPSSSTSTTTNAPTTTVATATTDASKQDDSNQIIAKIDLVKGTVLSKDMLELSSEKTKDDLRLEQYNMIVLPANLKENDTVDIRLRLPNGTDYVVLSKKRVMLPALSVSSDNTTASAGKATDSIQIKVSEQELLLMSSAIIDAYKIPGSKLYAIRYTAPGLQKNATITYVPSADTLSLMDRDPNILNEAKSALYKYYQQGDNNSTNAAKNRNQINDAEGSVDDSTAKTAVQTGTSAEASALKSQRQQYLQASED